MWVKITNAKGGVAEEVYEHLVKNNRFFCIIQRPPSSNFTKATLHLQFPYFTNYN